jgi:hypothetical protein
MRDLSKSLELSEREMLALAKGYASEGGARERA